MLYEIEEALGIDSPRLPSSLGSAPRHRCAGRRPANAAGLLTGLSLLLTGLTVLLLGVHADIGLRVGPGAVGYLVIVVAAMVHSPRCADGATAAEEMSINDRDNDVYKAYILRTFTSPGSPA
jgi:hypothetical protein